MCAMSPVKTAVFLALAAIALYYVGVLVAAWRQRAGAAAHAPSAGLLSIGFVTNFFDTLGIGSFATTTSVYKLKQLVRDEVIPGTLNVGHTLPTIAQAFIYIAVIEVDMTTLLSMIAASMLGTWFGAGVVASWPRRNVQVGMGIALLAAAGLMLSKLIGVSAPEGAALALHGLPLLLGIAGNFVLGALMSLGIGLYAPCLIMVSLLGMSPKAAFPIMMGSCAFLMPVASARFVRKRSFDLRAAVGLAIGGVPAVLIAGLIVKSLPLLYVRWLVVVVVVYTALMMLRSAIVERGAAVREAAQPEA
jgi:uncharacterized membrane protein YfcA